MADVADANDNINVKNENKDNSSTITTTNTDTQQVNILKVLLSKDPRQRKPVDIGQIRHKLIKNDFFLKLDNLKRRKFCKVILYHSLVLDQHLYDKGRKADKSKEDARDLEVEGILFVFFFVSVLAVKAMTTIIQQLIFEETTCIQAAFSCVNENILLHH